MIVSESLVNHIWVTAVDSPQALDVVESALSGRPRRFDLDVSTARDQQDVDRLFEHAFEIPYPFAGRDAIVSLVADLDWHDCADGYVIVVAGLDTCPSDVAAVVAGVWPPICDRFRSAGTPCLVVLQTSTARDIVVTALATSNDRLTEFGKLPTTINPTGPVDVTVLG